MLAGSRVAWVLRSWPAGRTSMRRQTVLHPHQAFPQPSGKLTISKIAIRPKSQLWREDNTGPALHVFQTTSLLIFLSGSLASPEHRLAPLLCHPQLRTPPHHPKSKKAFPTRRHCDTAVHPGWHGEGCAQLCGMAGRFLGVWGYWRLDGCRSVSALGDH